MIILGTSALVRFFTNDIPEKADKIKGIIDSSIKIFIPDVVFSELEYVLLGKTYESNRKKNLKAFKFLVTKKISLFLNQLKTLLKFTRLQGLTWPIALLLLMHEAINS